MTIRIQEADFDVGAELAALRAGDTRIGALASFIGLVRDVSHGTGVSEMTLEHYPGMTENALAAIVDENRLHVWDAATGALLFDHGDEYIFNNQLMFSSDNRMIVTADWDGLIRVWGIPE